MRIENRETKDSGFKIALIEGGWSLEDEVYCQGTIDCLLNLETLHLSKIVNIDKETFNRLSKYIEHIESAPKHIRELITDEDVEYYIICNISLAEFDDDMKNQINIMKLVGIL